MPTLTVRPDSTGANAGIIASTGTPYADLSDNNDNTVVRGSADGGYLWVGFGNVTLSAGQRVRWVQFRVRRARDTNDIGRIEKARIRLNYNGTFGPAGYPDAYYTNQDTWQGAQQHSAPGSRVWTQTLVNALTAEIYWYANDSGTFFLRIAEVYLDVQTNSPPSVGTPTVAGQTISTQPTTTIVYTDADNDPMVRSRWKWFSAAQYGAAGFNPDTSKAVYDTGEITGVTTVRQPGVGLVNGTTYKSYVKAAQDWSGQLDGPLWWSAWGVSAAFTIALTPPTTPTLAVTTQAVLPDFRAVLTVVAAASPGGFSTATGTVLVERGERLPGGRGALDNWVPAQINTGGTTTRSGLGFKKDAGSDLLAWEPIGLATVPGVGGAIHWLVRTATTGQFIAGGSSTDPDADVDYRFAVAPGLSHTGRVTAWCGSGTFATHVAIDWIKANETVTQTIQTITVTTTPAVYTVTGTAPADAVSARLVMRNNSSVASADVWATRYEFGLAPTAGAPGVGDELTWSTVRQLTSTDIAAMTSSQTFVVQDNEIPPARPVLYRATTIATLATGETVASAPSPAVAAYLPSPARSLLLDPYQPEQVVMAAVDVGDRRSQSKDNTVIHPAGRDRDPIVVTAWRGGLDPGYQLAAMSDADLARMLAILDEATVALIQWPEGGQDYLLVTGWDTVRIVPGKHEISLTALSCKRPG